jgi:wyosine [tRNA(Phe)-imidazoG37] synthetase (radical SAM superfamily)
MPDSLPSSQEELIASGAGVASGAPARLPKAPRPEAAFGYPRQFWDNRFVYTVLSPRIGRLSLGIDLNPDKRCNFDCVYCDVDRTQPGRDSGVDIEAMAAELVKMLGLAQEGRLREMPFYRSVPEELLQVREVTLSGQGEPTLCPQFAEVVEAVIHVRAQGRLPYFKLILITNGSGLHLPEVRQGLRWFNSSDEIWVKFEAGTQEHMNRIHRTEVPLKKVMANILKLGQQRSIVLQSLFPLFEDRGPSEEEIESFLQRLVELKSQGAQIALVQVYSAHRPTTHPQCGHLPLRTLSQLAQRIKTTTGLRAEVF